jgi:hypothetical protein
VYPWGVCSTIVEAARALSADMASADAATHTERIRVLMACVLLRFARVRSVGRAGILVSAARNGDGEHPELAP